ncbi:hypothetical protein VP01_2331g1 [Puccinia sorghi]|uniref:Uncharacterized protein n=1 Tax=Puccinia sorghi TaxID=27349 RepID=A0A0L6V868_9BASI|nr:hypothetical protein VP01_2331g1 [Puccinia sorghi]
MHLAALDIHFNLFIFISYIYVEFTQIWSTMLNWLQISAKNNWTQLTTFSERWNLYSCYLFTLKTKLTQLPAVDMQKVPGSFCLIVPNHLNMQTGVFWMAAWLEHAACQLQAVEQVFFLKGWCCRIKQHLHLVSLKISFLTFIFSLSLRMGCCGASIICTSASLIYAGETQMYAHKFAFPNCQFVLSELISWVNSKSLGARPYGHFIVEVLDHSPDEKDGWVCGMKASRFFKCRWLISVSSLVFYTKFQLLVVSSKKKKKKKKNLLQLLLFFFLFSTKIHEQTHNISLISGMKVVSTYHMVIIFFTLFRDSAQLQSFKNFDAKRITLIITWFSPKWKGLLQDILIFHLYIKNWKYRPPNWSSLFRLELSFDGVSILNLVSNTYLVLLLVETTLIFIMNLNTNKLNQFKTGFIHQTQSEGNVHTLPFQKIKKYSVKIDPEFIPQNQNINQDSFLSVGRNIRMCPCFVNVNLTNTSCNCWEWCPGDYLSVVSVSKKRKDRKMENFMCIIVIIMLLGHNWPIVFIVLCTISLIYLFFEEEMHLRTPQVVVLDSGENPLFLLPIGKPYQIRPGTQYISCNIMWIILCIIVFIMLFICIKAGMVSGARHHLVALTASVGVVTFGGCRSDLWGLRTQPPILKRYYVLLSPTNSSNTAHNLMSPVISCLLIGPVVVDFRNGDAKREIQPFQCVERVCKLHYWKLIPLLLRRIPHSSSPAHLNVWSIPAGSERSPPISPGHSTYHSDPDSDSHEYTVDNSFRLCPIPLVPKPTLPQAKLPERPQPFPSPFINKYSYLYSQALTLHIVSQPTTEEKLKIQILIQTRQV